MTRLVPELYCTDIGKSLEFYTGILGFSVLYDRPDEGFAYLGRQGAELMLDEVDKTRTWLKGPLDFPFGRGVNLQIETDEVENLYKTVKTSGVDVFMDLEKKWYRCGSEIKGNWQFIVCDPDGYLLRFFQDLGIKTDE